MFLVLEECVAICNSDVIVCNVGSSLIHFFIALNMFWCTFDEFMTWFCFSGRISRVHFVVYLLLSIIAVIT